MPGFSSRTFIAPQPLTSFWAASDVPLHQDGLVVSADDSGWWGAGGEFMYVRTGAAIAQFALCVVAPVFNAALGRFEYVATECPNTPNLGRPVGVAMASAVANRWIWLQLAGITPVRSTASVAADSAFGLTGSGTVGAVTAGRQVLNARTVAPATTTVAKTGCTTAVGTTLLRVPNAEGWFPGLFLSGTGIATGTFVTGINVNNNEVTLSAATTAQVGTVTGTYNNGTVFFNVAYFNRSFVQGQTT